MRYHRNLRITNVIVLNCSTQCRLTLREKAEQENPSKDLLQTSAYFYMNTPEDKVQKNFACKALLRRHYRRTSSIQML